MQQNLEMDNPDTSANTQNVDQWIKQISIVNIYLNDSVLFNIIKNHHLLKESYLVFLVVYDFVIWQ